MKKVQFKASGISTSFSAPFSIIDGTTPTKFHSIVNGTNQAVYVQLLANNTTALNGTDNTFQVIAGDTVNYRGRFSYIRVKAVTTAPTTGTLDADCGIISDSVIDMNTEFVNPATAVATTILPTDLITINRPDVGNMVSSIGSIPVVATYAALPATANDGQEALIPKLAGSGFFRVRYMTATSRWGVCAGECLFSGSDTLSVVTAPNTTPVDLALCTIPAGLIGVGEVWELFGSADVPANTGSDSYTVLIGSGITIGPLAVPPSTTYQTTIRFGVLSATSTRRSFASFSSTISTGTVAYSFIVANTQAVTLRITPAQAGNSLYIRNVSFRRVA